jgi:hypothetical protein
LIEGIRVQNFASTIICYASIAILEQNRRAKDKMQQPQSKQKTKDKLNSTAIKHELNSIVVEQRVADGFINGTAMCVAHGKLIKEWLSNQSTLELLKALTIDIGFEVKGGNSPLSSATRVSAAFPDLIVSKRGSPENGGGVWLHPDLAIQLAQWCNPFFGSCRSRCNRDLPRLILCLCS